MFLGCLHPGPGLNTTSTTTMMGYYLCEIFLPCDTLTFYLVNTCNVCIINILLRSSHSCNNKEVSTNQCFYNMINKDKIITVILVIQ